MSARGETAAAVEGRAGGRCEYCRMHQSLQGATFHVEHVRPRVLGGLSGLDNLAWSCPSCNLHKSGGVAAADPQTGSEVRLFKARLDRWDEHFGWVGQRVIGRTPVGRATVDALHLNHARRLLIRRAEALFGWFPP